MTGEEVAKAHETVSEQVDPHEFGGRTRSAALLAWFLENVWRLDPVEVEDAICDGEGDMGIDGLVVNNDVREIHVFQVRHVDKPERREGDSKIKAFRGVGPHFRSGEAVEKLIEAGPNEELLALLERNEVADQLGSGEGWAVELVYVTNAASDPAAIDYLNATEDETPTLDYWDLERIYPVADRTMAPGLLDEDVVLKASDYLVHELDGAREMAVAIVRADQLVDLPGIDTLSIFDLNVRLSLGRTKINRELRDAVQDEDDHQLFPAYHNGMTLLTHGLTVSPVTPGDDGHADELSEISLNGVSVVNGCQSLLTLYDNRKSITPELAIPVKVIELGEDNELAEEITYRSNNQNSVNTRDQRSTHATQLDLQREVEAHYGGRLAYQIREGEKLDEEAEVLDNRTAAQLIMAVYVGEPQRAVRRVALFDKEYHRIFGRKINAHRLYLLHVLDKVVAAQRDSLPPNLASAFASVRFTILNLTAEVVAESELGKQLLEDPEQWLPELTEDVSDELKRLAAGVCDTLEFFVKDRAEAAQEGDKPFDPKVVFKSVEGVRELREQALKDARYVHRKESESGGYYFGLEPPD